MPDEQAGYEDLQVAEDYNTFTTAAQNRDSTGSHIAAQRFLLHHWCCWHPKWCTILATFQTRIGELAGARFFM